MTMTPLKSGILASIVAASAIGTVLIISQKMRDDLTEQVAMPRPQPTGVESQMFYIDASGRTLGPMFPVDSVGAIILHLCPFERDGESLAAVPIIDMLALQQAARNGAVFLSQVKNAGTMIIVKPTTDKCQPYDGVSIPGVLPK
jgi:hypothetical protein